MLWLYIVMYILLKWKEIKVFNYYFITVLPTSEYTDLDSINFNCVFDVECCDLAYVFFSGEGLWGIEPNV